MPAMPRRMMIDPRKIEPPWLQNDAGAYEQFDIQYQNFFATAATTVNFDLPGYPGGALIIGAFFRLRKAFLGGAIATATLSLGSTGAPAAYITASNVFAGAPSTFVGVALPFGTFVNAPTPLVGGTIRAQLIVAGANATALTQGDATVFIWLSASKLYFAG